MNDNTPVDLAEQRKLRREGLSLLTTERAPNCYPCAWLVNGKTRTVQCRKCQRVIEPFDALMEMAHDFEGYARNRDHLRQEVTRLSDVRTDLKKKVDSLKGMERRLLKDANLVAGQIADRLDAMNLDMVKAQYRPVVAWLAQIVRDGRWRGKPE